MLKITHSMIDFYTKNVPLDEFISEYRRIYQRGTELFAQYNPCEAQDNSCWSSRNDENRTTPFCCSGCEYVSDAGCLAEALWCKLWICGSLRVFNRISKEFSDELAELNRQAGQLCHHIGGRRDMGDFIKRIYGPKVHKQWEVLKQRKLEAS